MTSDIQIFDKIIPSGYADAIETDLMRTSFPWHYINDVTNKKYGNNSGFVHLAHDMGIQPSNWFPFIKPLVYSIEEATNHKITELLRIRVGFLLKNQNAGYQYNTPHVDFTINHHTACYYVNDTDGDTVLFDKFLKDMGKEVTEENLNEYAKNTEFNVVERSTPKKGGLCVFDGLRFHSSTNPANHDRRLVITINYI